jgi:hypothetical protein
VKPHFKLTLAGSLIPTIRASCVSKLKRAPGLGLRIRTLVDEGLMTHGQFAQLLDMPLERLRSLMSGKAVKCRPEEIKNIRRRLGVSEIWLTKGEGPMYVGTKGKAE